MQNSVVMFLFCVFDRKYPFRANLVQNIQIDSLTWNLVPKVIGMIVWANLVQNIKTDSLTWNFVPRVIRMMVFRCFILDRKHPFCANFVKKTKIVSLSWNLVPRIIRISRIQWWCSLFLLQTRNTLYGQIWSKKSILSV